MGGFDNKQLYDIVTTAMFDEIDKLQTDLIDFGTEAMVTDIKKRQATDTNLLVNNVAVKTKRLKTKYKIRYFIRNKKYNNKNHTPASYTPDTAPATPPPNYEPSTELKDTTYSAIQVIWGLGVHRKKGARNFPRVAMEKTIKKFFAS